MILLLSVCSGAIAKLIWSDTTVDIVLHCLPDLPDATSTYAPTRLRKLGDAVFAQIVETTSNNNNEEAKQ